MDVNQLSLGGTEPSVSTDLLDYLPGSTATITASGFIVGSTIEFQVFHVLDAGADGVYGTLDDTITGSNSNDIIDGGSDTDTASGGNGKDVIYGGSGRE